MKRRPKEPPVPPERTDTVRHEIISVLEGRTASAREISASVGIPEKEVYDHLEHIHKTMGKRSRHLVVTSAQCLKCGFVFKKREKLTKPGRCPVCHGELIEEPLFSIKEAAE
jgi:predicted Zn-ribbon and HTH transcriptional regulator